LKIAIHSFKGGTGKSTVCANLAVLLALRERKVAVVDHDLTAPGIHIIYDVPQPKYTLNDLLDAKCRIDDVVLDITDQLKLKTGRLYLVPASLRADSIIRVINEGYDPIMFVEILKRIYEAYQLDILLVDTHPGISDDVLLTLAACDLVLVLSRLDKQDYIGTEATLELTRRFGREVRLLLNEVPLGIPVDTVKKRIESAFKEEVMGILPFAEDLFSSGSERLFAIHEPGHPFLSALEQVASKILKLKGGKGG
jgi:MinD-like ATPase involved in chromosome partitioning or flagellar assembly